MGEMKDKIKGNFNEAVGEAKRQSADPKTRQEGSDQKLKGKAQQLKGQIKGALSDDI